MKSNFKFFGGTLAHLNKVLQKSKRKEMHDNDDLNLITDLSDKNTVED